MTQQRAEIAVAVKMALIIGFLLFPMIGHAQIDAREIAMGHCKMDEIKGSISPTKSDQFLEACMASRGFARNVGGFCLGGPGNAFCYKTQESTVDTWSSWFKKTFGNQ